jgi:ElaB/YqjD/DUF883 family membrane-anchored ribosome-binding protein
MPLTPQDTHPTFQDEILERAEDLLDTMSYYARRKPLLTVAVAFTLGLLTAQALTRRF